MRFQLLADKVGAVPFGEIVDFAVQVLVSHSFSKTQEDDADEYAYAVLAYGPYDPGGVGAAFASLLAYQAAAEYREPAGVNPIRDYFRSHPPLAVREAEFRARAEAWWQRHPGERRAVGAPNHSTPARRARALALLLVAGATGPALAQSSDDGDWPVYGRDLGGTRFSPLTEITRTNVARLHIAWTYHTGEMAERFATAEETALEVTPLVIDGIMYLSTPLGRVIALDAATGAERWAFDPGIDRSITYGDFTNRGVAAWLDSVLPPGSPCRLRIYVAPIDGRLIALDAQDGRPCRDFGDGGTVRLKTQLRVPPFEEAAYEVTSPPVVVNGLVIVGSAIGDNSRLAPASGEVQAFDARSGRRRWAWDPIPQDPADPASATWQHASARTTGSANVWSVMAADPGRDLVFAPTSSPAPDYYGGKRLGANRYGNSLVALRASTGAVVWDFQTVHHDLWDYDNASPPALVTITRDGRPVPAALQATKTGMLFVLHRETGRPLLPVEERSVPASTVPGEEAWPTQPFTAAIAPLSPHRVGPDDAWGVDSAEREACRQRLSGLRNEGIFTPPSVEGTLVIPSNIGGAHWGGLAWDPSREIAVVPVNRLAAMVQLLGADTLTESEADRAEDRTGLEYTRMEGTPYVMRRGFLLSPGGLPCTPPPWGALVAVSLKTGAKLWDVPLGTMPAGVGRPPAGTEWGSPNLGGPIATAGGLVFVGATLDRRFRAFDIETGRTLWTADLPAGARATPMTYSAGGRQYVAIAAGGGGRFGKGDAIMAFALPAEVGLSGTWDGHWTRAGDTMAVTMVVRQDSAGGHAATFGTDRLRVSGIPFAEVRVRGCCDVTLVLRGDRTTTGFVGRLAGDSLTGVLREDTSAGRFAYARVRAAPPAVLEREVTFANGNVTLAGTLLLPASGDSLPAVVFLHGSGAEGRWASRYLGTQLALHGIAALIYDKRGVGSSTGDWRRSTPDDLIGDGVTAVARLRVEPRIDPRRIGVHGHSQGGTLAPFVAVRAPAVAFVVGSAAAGLPLDSVEIFSVLNAVLPGIASAEDSGDARAFVGELVAVAYQGRSPARLDSLVTRWRDRPWFFEPPPPADGYWAFSRAFAPLRPLDWWAQVRVPVLLVYGAADQRVPAAESAERIAAALRGAGNPAVTVRIFPGADHTFRLAAGASGWPRSAPDYVATLLGWLATR